MKYVLKLYQKEIKMKKRKKIPKEIKSLLNKIEMLKRDKHKAYSKEKKKHIDRL